MKKKLWTWIVSAGIFLALVGGIFAYDDRLAKSDDLVIVREEIQLVGKRLEQKILEDKIYNLQKRIWLLEDRYGGRDVPNAPSEVKEEYRQLLIEINKLKNNLRG